jgi:hypothetical protein
MNDGRHYYDAGEEGGVVQELAWEADQGGDVFGGGQAFRGVDFPGLCREENLAWLHANVHAFDSSEA